MSSPQYARHRFLPAAMHEEVFNRRLRGIARQVFALRASAYLAIGIKGHMGMCFSSGLGAAVSADARRRSGSKQTPQGKVPASRTDDLDRRMSQTLQ